MPTYSESEYQVAINKWVREGTGHAVISAVPGSGKSTTLETAAREHISPRDRVLALAFNKTIRDALVLRMPVNVKCATFNAFGWELCRRNVPGVMLEPLKDSFILQELCDSDRARMKRIRKPVLQMVSLLKALDQYDTKAWKDICRDYGVELGDLDAKDKFEEALDYVFMSSVNTLGIMNFDDQLYMPIAQNWALPSYDFVLIDESQDCSPIQIELAHRLVKNGGRLMFVGDPFQSIYLFRGAHPDAMGKMGTLLEATTLPLNYCYRCSDAVIAEAQKLAPHIRAPKPNPNGKGVVDLIGPDDFYNKVESGDFVLCRTVAPLIRRCLRLLKMGKKATVKGRDLVEQIIGLVEQIHGNRVALSRSVSAYRTTGQFRNDEVSIIEFLERLDRYKMGKLALFEAQGRDGEAAALQDRCDAINAFAESCHHVGEIITKVEDITAESPTDGIVLMTAHKAKGLEARVVYILRPDLLPHPRAKTDAALVQERNLHLVAVTRARSDLHYVKPERDEISPKQRGQKNDFVHAESHHTEWEN